MSSYGTVFEKCRATTEEAEYTRLRQAIETLQERLVKTNAENVVLKHGLRRAYDFMREKGIDKDDAPQLLSHIKEYYL